MKKLAIFIAILAIGVIAFAGRYDFSTSSSTATAIADNLIVMADLNQDSEPDDGDYLTYDSTGGNFEWVTFNAGTDPTSDLEEETHASEHAVGGTDSVFPADPDEDAFYQWDDANGVGVWKALGDLFLTAGTDPDLSTSGEVSVDTDGANEPNDVILRTTDTGGDTQYALARVIQNFTKTVWQPQSAPDALRDRCVLWHNTTGMTATMTQIMAWSNVDDTSVNLEIVTETDWSSPSTLDALEIASDGTSVYYVTETSFTDATVENGELVVADFDDTDDPNTVTFSFSYYLNADVD